MSDEPPTPPTDLPADLADALEDRSPEQLRSLARYAEDLADHRASEATSAEASAGGERDDADGEQDEADAEEAADLPVDRPASVPTKAAITIKEINDNRYYYWQWREGDSVRSQYEGPVDGDE